MQIFIGSSGCGKSAVLHELVNRIENPSASKIKFPLESHQLLNTTFLQYVSSMAVVVIDLKLVEVQTERDLAAFLLQRSGLLNYMSLIFVFNVLTFYFVY